MIESKTVKHKHLTIQERDEIQACLDHGMGFKAIGQRISKDQTTVSKEVKRHIIFPESRYLHCDDQGKELPLESCPSLVKAPFVCNACTKRHQCRKRRQLYSARHAQKAYEQLLGESRSGIPLNKEQFYQNDRVISQGIKNGQHLYHIIQTNSLGVSKSTVYRHLKKGYLSVISLDFPRVVKFKPRRNHREDYVPPALRAGRSHDDFLTYCLEHEVLRWAEMDTVVGRIGGKVILTLDFTLCNFMIGLLLDNKTAAEASGKVLALKKRFSSCGLSFADIFPLILTDNGGEFSDVHSLENNLDGVKETELFFCDPNKAYQKPKVEKNHTLFRDIIPKGESFDHLSQDSVNLIFSHVNSVKRKSLHGKSSFEVFAFTYGPEIPAVLGISFVEPQLVIQSPKLLKTLK